MDKLTYVDDIVSASREVIAHNLIAKIRHSSSNTMSELILRAGHLEGLRQAV